MKIEILNFELIDKGACVARVDVKITHSENKWEIFRSVGYFEKNEKKWVNLPSIKRDDKYIVFYEREPKWPSSEVLNAIVNYIAKL